MKDLEEKLDSLAMDYERLWSTVQVRSQFEKYCKAKDPTKTFTKHSEELSTDVTFADECKKIAGVFGVDFADIKRDVCSFYSDLSSKIHFPSRKGAAFI
jgi:hypothetical protein